MLLFILGIEYSWLICVEWKEKCRKTVEWKEKYAKKKNEKCAKKCEKCRKNVEWKEKYAKLSILVDLTILQMLR